MKRLYLSIFLFLLAFPLSAKNKISMVTYFPVPYVAYSQVNAGQMDIGLTSTCDMKLGCDSITIPLTANTVNMAHGRLDLDGGRGIVGDSLTLGNGEGGGQVHFKDVRIQTGNMESVNVGTAMKVSTLNLFGKQFPSCIGANAASNGQMSWQKLKLAGANSEELYLMCGGTTTAAEPEGTCSDRTYKLAHKSECCPSTSTTDTDCWRQTCNYRWVDGRTADSVSGASGYDNAKSPIGYCNARCSPTYRLDSYSGGCISERNAPELLAKVNIKPCASTYNVGDSCGVSQENEHCYYEYEFKYTGGAPCVHYSIRVSSGVQCQKSCSYVKNY